MDGGGTVMPRKAVTGSDGLSSSETDGMARPDQYRYAANSSADFKAGERLVQLGYQIRVAALHVVT